jgi:hypothetical protein
MSSGRTPASLISPAALEEPKIECLRWSLEVFRDAGIGEVGIVSAGVQFGQQQRMERWP